MRLVIFAAMAGLLVVALCIPEAFGEEALLFACAYGIVRYRQEMHRPPVETTVGVTKN